VLIHAYHIHSFTHIRVPIGKQLWQLLGNFWVGTSEMKLGLLPLGIFYCLQDRLVFFLIHLISVIIYFFDPMNLSMLSLNLSMLLFPVHGIIVGLCAPAHFFSGKDSRSTVLSFKKKAIVHHTPKRTPPPHKQRTQQNATPPQRTQRTSTYC